ncbi:MAG TPA: sialidase family protein [Streptosporangiaceae bacterium]
MVSTTDLDETPAFQLLLPPIPEPVPGDEPLAGRGHPGGPGFTPEGSPADPLTGASVWQQAQAAWLAAGADWSGPLTAPAPTPSSVVAPSRASVQQARRAPQAPRTPRARRRLMIVAIVLVVAVAGGGYAWVISGRVGPRAYPAAQTGQFTGGPASPVRGGAGVFQTLTQVTSSDGTVVAVGRQAGGDVTRAQFLVSTDAGSSWQVAPVRAAAGGDPAPGHPAQLVVAGPQGWLAVGPDAIWTSADGRSWTLARTTGITPTDSGDQVQLLIRTATGYLAAGQNTAEGTGVVWTSPDGLHWLRETAAQARLPVHHGTIVTITGAAAHGQDILLSGQMSPWYESAGPRNAMTWLSSDDGATWRTVSVPVSQGAGSALTGLAAAGRGFVAVRPLHSGQGGVVYASADGASWRYVTRLSSASGLKITAVNGGTGGYSVLGQVPRGAMYGFTSTDGTHWQKAASFGQAPGSTTGVAITGDGVLVATGATSTGAGTSMGAGTARTGERPYLAVAGPGQDPQVVSVTGLAGAAVTQTGVTAVAVDGQRRVVVGEQGGTLAVWSGSTTSSQNIPGTWATVSGLPPAVDGTQRLISVVHGPAGWLATGEAVTGTISYPVAAFSADGRSWQPVRSGALTQTHAIAVQAAANADGYVVVGRATADSGTVPAVWFSADLRTWTRVSTGSGPAGMPSPGQLAGVASAAAGFVAVGAAGTDPAVWTSADGRHWATHVLTIPGTGASTQLTQVAARGRTVVAFGQEVWATGRRAALAEVSHDGGRTWTPVPFTAASVPPHGTAASTATVTAVTAMSGGFTAVGSYGPARDRDVQVWTSANGNGWLTQTPHGTGLSGPGLQQISGLAAAGTALTGVGFTATATAEQPTLWPVPAR